MTTTHALKTIPDFSPTDEVRAIRSRLTGRRGENRALAGEYGVSEQLICDIKKGRRWVTV